MTPRNQTNYMPEPCSLPLVDEETGLIGSNSTENRKSHSTNSDMDQRKRNFANTSLKSASGIIEGIRDDFEDLKADMTHIVIGSSRGPKRDMTYDASNHTLVMLRMYGSVWPKVLPYCIANTIWTLVIYLLSYYNILDLTLHTTVAHTFMSTLVSFLLVSRSNMTYTRFMECRAHLEECFSSCRELINSASSMTFYDANAKDWRHQLAFSTIVLLHTSMEILDFKSKDPSGDSGRKIDKVLFQDLKHFDRTVVDENFRATSVLSSKVRQTIVSHRNTSSLLGRSPLLSESQEATLVSNLSGYHRALSGLRTLATTPFPFATVQMTRWFLFAWIFTLPMTLTDAMEYISETMVVVFFVTYGFLGIEYVSMELDDPFGDDPSDFDQKGMAEIVYEDMYLEIMRVDGKEAAKRLREDVVGYVSRGNALDVYREDVEKDSFWSKDD